MESFWQWLNPSGFMPHGYCFLWRPDVLWLHVVSDLIIALSYCSIPAVLVAVLRKRRSHIEMPGLLVLFAMFILACGTNHLLEVWTLWHPAYRLAGLAKGVTALVSLYTALTLLLNFNKLLKLPTATQVRENFAALEVAQLQIRQSNAELQQALNFDLMLRRLTDKIRQSLDEDEIVNSAVRGLTLLLGALSCDAITYDLELGVATVRQDFFVSGRTNVGVIILLDSWSDIYARLNGDESVVFCWLQEDSLRGLSATVSAPIRDEQGLIGSLQLSNHEGYIFSEIEQHLVCQVAAQCAIAIRQARLYQRVQDQVHQLEFANSLKDEFLSTVSHELRTPISNMKMAIAMIDVVFHQADPISHKERLTRYIEILRYECKRENELINDLLDLQRLECGDQPSTIEGIDLHPWLVSVSSPFLDRFIERNQVFDVSLSFDSLLIIQSDKAGLTRVVSELLNNACKYTPAGQRIHLFSSVENNCLKIQVLNSGSEIPTEHLPRIFDKFYRANTNDPWNSGGTGLGLALVRRLCQELGGDITVESGLQETCFTVVLPLAPDPVLNPLLVASN